MKNYLLVFCLVLLWSAAPAGLHPVSAASESDAPAPTLENTYALLKILQFDGRCLTLQQPVTLSFPDCRITVSSGNVYSLGRVDSLETGFLLVGDMEIVFRPRHALEQQQLRRFTGSDSLTARSDRLYLRSLNPQFRLEQLGSPAKDCTPNDALLEFPRLCHASLLEQRGFNLAARLLSELLLEADGYVILAFRDIKEDRSFPPIYYYVYDPYAHETIQLYQYRPRRIGKPFYTVCSYPEGDYLAPPPQPSLQITKYNGWIQIDERGHVNADLGVDLFTHGKRVRLAYFQLSQLLKVNFVTTEFGDSLEFIQEDGEGGFTLVLPDTMAARDTVRLLFSYSGPLMEQNNDGNWYVKDRINWHPRLGYYRRARYKLIFKYPRDLQVVSIGKLVKDWYENGWHLSYYVHNVPAKASLFAMGKFTRDAFWGPDSVYIELFARASNKETSFRRIVADVANSLYFFSRYLSPYAYRSLKIVEAPRLDSQGFPGFINLSWISFTSQPRGNLAALRSHEVAHQWWGNHVGWRTYRDQWLSEGFAEYMAALYLAWADPSSGYFDEILQAWRDDIIEGGNIGVSLGLRKFGFSKAALRNSDLERSGPIFLGHRLGQKEPTDYYLFVYEKAAYLLHMLRYYVMDDRTGSDETFWRLLNAFTNRYSGQEPTTAEFIQFVSDYLGEDMRWFFDQWLLSNQIPTYEYFYETKQDTSGYWLAGRVLQKDVPSTFRAAIPVNIIFGDKTSTRRRIFIDKERTSFRFGPFPNRPQEFVFNIDGAVLARIREKK